MAKTAKNSKSGSGRSRAGGKAVGRAGGKAAPRRAEGKPGRGKTSAKAQQKGRAEGKPGRGKTSAKAQQKGRAGKSTERRGLRRFLHDVRIEMGKVVWPTRKDLAQSTLVVLVAVAIATAYTYGLDVVFAKAVDLVFKAIFSG